MRDPRTSNSQPQAKQALCAASASPSPYPVSIRAYKKKDYEYLSTFPRMAVHTALRPSRSDAELLQARSDGESDLSMTTSSTEYSTSTSSSSSTSSAQSYVKEVIAFVDMQESPYQREHHHHHHLLNTQASTHSARISVDRSDSRAEANKFDKLHNGSHAEMTDIGNLCITGDSSGPHRENGIVQDNAPIRPRGKPKPMPNSTPAVLPKFGSWDTKNPSSGEAYTLIFRRLRDEKKSGGLPVCGSSIHTETEGAVDSFQPEGKAKGSLHPDPQAKNRSSRRKAKDTSPREAACNRKRSPRWNVCCKPSVLDD